MSKKSAPLLYSSSEASPDVLYFGQFFCPDPFISLQVGKKKIALLNKLEYSRGLKESAFDIILPLEDWAKKSKKTFPKVASGPAQWICLLAKHFKLKSFKVHNNFPSGLLIQLQKAKIKVEVVEGALFPERYIKTEKEIKWITQALKITAGALGVAEKILKASKINKGYIHYEGKKLTAERLRFFMDSYCLEQGAVAQHTIVAGGPQGCDPHCMGSGPLKANELIVVDVFPRVTKTGFYGDMTRTFLKGKPTAAQRLLYKAVHEAQKKAMAAIKHKAEGKAVHKAAADYFEAKGYKTENIKSINQGFIHGTGHGLGLDLHEDLRINTNGDKLKSGHVFTVEPGLYYPKIGGVRIEDVVEVTQSGYNKLSNFHYNWIIE